MRYHSPRIAPRDQPEAVIKYLTSGLMAWQSEGSNVYYRDLKIKLFPEDPLYETLYPASLRERIGRSDKPAGARPTLRFEYGFPVIEMPSGKTVSPQGRTQKVSTGPQAP